MVVVLETKIGDCIECRIKKAIPPSDVRASWRYSSICTQITTTPRKYLLGMWFEWLLGQTGAPKGDAYIYTTRI